MNATVALRLLPRIAGSLLLLAAAPVFAQSTSNTADALRASMVCAQCHSRRDAIAAGYRAGESFYDYFAPALEYSRPRNDTAYWPDGRPRRASNEALVLWQSRCFIKGGATCSTCHANAHDAAAPASKAGDSSCSGCHQAIARDAPAHTHHGANSTGSSCVACHMPEVGTTQAPMRDHTISVPAPENTTRHGIPNACNTCHQDKDAAWASQKVAAWYGTKAGQVMVTRADAFTQAREGNPQSTAALLRLLGDRDSGSVLRANAAGYLGAFPEDPAAYQAMIAALTDSDPLLRATAAAAIEPRAAQRETVAPILAAMLRDPMALVRRNAVVAMVNLGLTQVPPSDQEWFDRARRLYAQQLDLYPTDAAKQFAAGKFFLAAGDNAAAVAALRASVKIDPATPAQYYLALASARGGDLASARQVLQDIAPRHPDYVLAQRLLAQIDLRVAGPSGDPGERAFLNGELQFLDNNYTAALPLLDEAVQGPREAAWSTKAKILRAVCLAKVGRVTEAEAAMQSLSATEEGRRDATLQVGYVELLYDSGRAGDALARVDALIAVVPDIPQAYFWRARALLQLGRTTDAAAAAEQAISFPAQLPAAHNLLLRIYQMQGRTKEAAQEAQWLRDYQRRTE